MNPNEPHAQFAIPQRPGHLLDLSEATPPAEAPMRTAEASNTAGSRSGAPTKSDLFPQPVGDLALAISAGIDRRGFHIAAMKEMDVLWGKGNPSREAQACRIETFALEHSWNASIKTDGSAVMFHPPGNAPHSFFEP